MGNYSLIIESIVTKHRDELNKLHPKANSAEDINHRVQYSSANRDNMFSDIKTMMKDMDIDFEDLKIRQEMINSLNQFHLYCLHYRSTQ
jgi:hypothetical protein